MNEFLNGLILVCMSVFAAILLLKRVIISNMNNVMAVFYKPHNPTLAGFTRYENLKRMYWFKGNYQIYLFSFNILYFFISSVAFANFPVMPPLEYWRGSIFALVLLLLIGLGPRWFVLWILIPFGMGYALAFLNNYLGGLLNQLPIFGSYFVQSQLNYVFAGVLAVLLLNSVMYARGFGVNFHLTRSKAKIEIMNRMNLFYKPISRSKIHFKKISSTYHKISFFILIYELFNIFSGMYYNPPHERILTFLFGPEIIRILPVRILSFMFLINISVFGLTILMEGIQGEFYEAIGERMLYSKVYPQEFNSEEIQIDKEHTREMESLGIRSAEIAERRGCISAQDRILGDVPLRWYRVALIFLLTDFLTSAISTFEFDLTGFPLTSPELASLSIAAKTIFYVISLIFIGGLYGFSDHIDDLHLKIQRFYATQDYVDLKSNIFLLQLARGHSKSYEDYLDELPGYPG